MATKKIEMNKAERNHRLPSLQEVQEIDKNVKKVLHIEAKGDKFIVEVEVAASKAAAKPKATAKPKAAAKPKKSLIGSDSE